MADDFSELRTLAADLTAAGAEVRPFAKQALHVTATNVKKAWRAKAARTYLGTYAKDVTFEVKESRSEIVAEIGPTSDGDAGALGIVEDAPGGVRSAPQHAGRDALKANAEDFERGIAYAVSDALKARGL